MGRRNFRCVAVLMVWPAWTRRAPSGRANRPHQGEKFALASAGLRTDGAPPSAHARHAQAGEGLASGTTEARPGGPVFKRGVTHPEPDRGAARGTARSIETANADMPVRFGKAGLADLTPPAMAESLCRDCREQRRHDAKHRDEAILQNTIDHVDAKSATAADAIAPPRGCRFPTPHRLIFIRIF